MTIPPHVTAADVLELSCKLMRADAYKIANQDARARQMKGRDKGALADHKAAIHRYEMMLGISRIAEGER